MRHGEPALELRSIRAGYSNSLVLKDVSMTIVDREIVALIGSNGAGKSTLLRTVSGLVPVSSGDILLRGSTIVGNPPSSIVEEGVIHCPEGRRIFARMSVLENLRIGHHVRRREASLQGALERVFGLFPLLHERQSQSAGTLSGGEQQMLAIGRALMASPRVLLLDEPSLGLAPRLVEQIFEIVRTINGQGTTILLVEQNARQALEIASWSYVLEAGTLALDGPAAAVQGDERVRTAYLGEDMA